MTWESNGNLSWRQPETDRPVQDIMALFGFFQQWKKNQGVKVLQRFGRSSIWLWPELFFLSRHWMWFPLHVPLVSNVSGNATAAKWSCWNLLDHIRNVNVVTAPTEVKRWVANETPNLIINLVEIKCLNSWWKKNVDAYIFIGQEEISAWTLTLCL